MCKPMHQSWAPARAIIMTSTTFPFFTISYSTQSRHQWCLNYSWCGVRLDHWRREVELTNDYPRLDESLWVLVERFPSLWPLAGAEFLNNGTLYPSMKAAIKTRQDKTPGYTWQLPGVAGKAWKVSKIGDFGPRCIQEVFRCIFLRKKIFMGGGDG